MYSNQIGGDGNRLYFDGCSAIAQNGQLLKIGSQFTINRLEVITAVLDLDSVRQRKIGFKSRCNVAPTIEPFYRVSVDFRLCTTDEHVSFPLSQDDLVRVIKSPSEEIALGPSAYLWDFLKKTGAAGYFLPLSGGADSSATACIIHNMSLQVFNAIVHDKNPEILAHVRKLVNDADFIPTKPQDITQTYLLYLLPTLTSVWPIHT